MKTLAEVIAEHRIVGSCGGLLAECACGDAMDDHAAHVAAAWRAERTITTRAGLDALPLATIAISAFGHGCVLEKTRPTEWSPPGADDDEEYPLDSAHLPMLILYLPGEEQ